LLRHAINQDWPVPLERRPLRLEAAMSPIYRDGVPPLLGLAACRVALAADLHDLKQKERARH
jgi:hypothetical protein